MEKIRVPEGGKALLFDSGRTEGGKAYTPKAADVQRQKALLFLAGCYDGKSYPEIKADYQKAGI
jgi:hypothetical protein